MNCKYHFHQMLFCLAIGIGVAGCAASFSGLRPEDPKPNSFSGPNTFSKVDSLQPTLRWEAFPRLQDREANPEGVLSRISNVTYELKIWRVKANNDFFKFGPYVSSDNVSDLVYERRGLTEPYHKVEHPLEPSTYYFWTIRARFELDGQPGIIQWGITAPAGLNAERALRLNYVPHPSYYGGGFYYSFRTPHKP